MVLNAGEVVAGYTIEVVLGAGGMGTVYRARHPTLPRSDALKVLSPQLSQDAHFRARFEREAELAATLDHPNIVTVYNRGETDGQLWIAMQYVAGSDADKELAAARMTPQRAVHVVAEVAKALDYAHRRHLLHRDVKPANFLLAPDDERVFLADFGIARALDEVVGLTQTGMVMASVAYAAPESLTGEPTDHRSDIYSLGCSLYRMLTGRAPYARSGGMAAAAAAHLTEPPPRVTDIDASLPAALDAVIATAMAKEPNQRYQTATDLARAAVRALDESTETVRQTPRTPMAPSWSGEHSPGRSQQGPSWSGEHSPGRSQPSSAHTPPPFPPYAQPYGGARPPWVTEAARAITPPPPRRRRVLPIAIVAVVTVLVAAGIGGYVAFSGDDAAPSYQAQTLVHQHGQAQLSAAPSAVVAAGSGDGDAVLSLGVQPVAIVSPGGALPSWEKQKVTGDVQVLAEADPAAIGATKPDLIIDTGEIDDAAYNALAAVAQTVTRPPNASGWTWQAQLEWIGRILGRSDQAKSLLDGAAAKQADIRAAHPAFDGKSVQVVLVADDGVSVAVAQSDSARYLQGLGFRYPSDLGAAGAGGLTRPVPDPAQLNATPTDVRLVVRTDQGAGGGSYNGLPQPFSSYKGITVIIDDPATVAALNVPGYAATDYLNTALVNQLARQIR
ncbi:serine/threonine-protein kinase [Mycolicibacterium frederiksbergense]|uniref:non-specific serine/threonine protein kinase n=1 Tax=Mycolicibacterium frederiksbergense TaxID=117567 RepID=A0A6H0S0H5_9MYCO|nr:serine/threonine-protein kinase [Mycolicibacterium frederiksbergense]QIV79825.1 serine/threonine protein kinase [Mycolicibacterium frederiksbergense]